MYEEFLASNRKKKYELYRQIQKLTKKMDDLDVRHANVVGGDVPIFSPKPLTQEMSLKWYLDGRDIAEVKRFADLANESPKDEWSHWVTWMLMSYEGEKDNACDDK